MDIVITWVNGNDPAHTAKRNSFLTDKKEDRFSDIAGKERFEVSGEIYICVGSILRFAPFVKRIFIVTDNQDPHLEEFVGRYFPETDVKIEIVDHKDIFRGYEDVLPTFNSLSIESVLYRIPGLGEDFVYFNDDVFLLKPVSEDVWFRNGKAVCYATKFRSGFARLLRFMKRKRNGHKPFGFKDSMLNAADLVSNGYFWCNTHTPHAMKKSVCESFYMGKEDVLRNNIRHRFREHSQYNPQALFYVLAEKEGKCVVENPAGKVLFLKPGKDKKGYMKRKLAQADRNPDMVFACINSLGETTADEAGLFIDWVRDRIGIDI